MTVPDSSESLSRVLTTVANSSSDPVCSEVESEVIRLFDGHRTRLLRYVLSIGLPVHDAEEIVQEVFLALFRHLQLGRPRKACQAGQSRPDHAELDEAVAAGHCDPAPSPEQQLAFSQRQQLLLAAFRLLPLRDQYCLHLRAEGLRYREIAEVLEMSLGAVSISLTRSISRLERADRG